MGTSTIIDGNSFTTAGLDDLTPGDRALVSRRMRVLGPSYRLFYRRPVHLVRGEGAHVWDDEGREYLDVYNNVVSIGHSRPEVADAVNRQLRTLNTHSRYLQSGIVDYSEQLLATFPDALSQVMYTNSGSESNDLALRIAFRATGGTGVVVTSEAYHGTTALCSDVSPAMGSDHRLGEDVETVPAPDSYRLRPPEGLGEWFAAELRGAFDRLRSRGVRPAAFLVDSIMASDGVLSDPSVLGPAIREAHAAGAVLICDEVQPGFARTGSTMWGFARHGIVPDLVTMGKPMGNGVPVAAVVAKPEVLDTFGTEVPYFNTFGGSTVPIAAAQAVLDVIQGENLAEHSEQLGSELRMELISLAAASDFIGDVRGAGLFTGVEIVRDRETRQPNPGLALDLINELREQGVLTSVCGPTNSVLKLRPLLCYSRADLDRLLTSLDTALRSCTA
jgi:4-aminobutyrate aminotransferase-like enzyme